MIALLKTWIRMIVALFQVPTAQPVEKLPNKLNLQYFDSEDGDEEAFDALEDEFPDLFAADDEDEDDELKLKKKRSSYQPGSRQHGNKKLKQDFCRKNRSRILTSRTTSSQGNMHKLRRSLESVLQLRSETRKNFRQLTLLSQRFGICSGWTNGRFLNSTRRVTTLRRARRLIMFTRILMN